MKDRIEQPTKERMAKGQFVQTDTMQAGVYVWQEHQPPPIIDQLHDARWIDDEQHQALSDYRNDLHMAGMMNSRTCNPRYGSVGGGEQSDRSALAFSRVTRIEAHVVHNAGFGVKDLMRAVCEDHAIMPVDGKPPIWIRSIRLAAGIARGWRG